MIGQRLVEIIDFKKDSLTIGFERAQIVFATGVVGVTKIPRRCRRRLGRLD